MILRQATIKYKGYDPDELKPYTCKKICISCDKCGRIKWLSMGNYNNQKNPDLCQSCSCSKENHPLWNTKHSQKTRQKMKNNHADFNGDKHPNYRGGKKILICEWCNKKYDRWDSIKNSKFCSNKCHGEYQSFNNKGKNNPNWRGGIATEPYCKLWTESFREMIRNRYHRKCYLCDKSEKINGRRLDVHHVNYDKNCLCQKTCEFVPLCRSCHSKTNKNRQYWEDLIMYYLFPERYFMVEL